MTERRRLTYANVVSTLALVVAVTGGGAAVAAGLAKNSVGSPQIKNGQVKAADLAGNAVTSAKVKDNSLTGADISEDTLTPDIASNVYAATVDSTGSLFLQQSRFATSAERNTLGRFYVTFSRSVATCSYATTITDPVNSNNPAGLAAASLLGGTTDTVYVTTRNAAGSLTDLGFGLVVVC